MECWVQNVQTPPGAAEVHNTIMRIAQFLAEFAQGSEPAPPFLRLGERDIASVFHLFYSTSIISRPLSSLHLSLHLSFSLSHSLCLSPSLAVSLSHCLSISPFSPVLFFNFLPPLSLFCSLLILSPVSPNIISTSSFRPFSLLSFSPYLRTFYSVSF